MLIDKRKRLKNYVILTSIWLLMSLVLSNAFKGLLLSSYANINTDLAVKSLHDLIDKPNVEIYQKKTLDFISKEAESEDIKKLKERISKNSTFIPEVFSDSKEIIKFQNGQAVILCNSYNCRFHQKLNPHLKLIYSDDHQFHSFTTLKVKKSHSHSLQIYKL